VIPDTTNPAKAPGAAAFERRDSGDGPDAKEAAAGIALNLKGEEKDLGEENAGEESERLVAGRNADHGRGSARELVARARMRTREAVVELEKFARIKIDHSAWKYFGLGPGNSRKDRRLACLKKF